MGEGKSGEGEEIYHERHEVHEEEKSGYDLNFVFFVYFVVKASDPFKPRTHPRQSALSA